MSKKFEKWWDEENCQSGYTTIFQTFQAGWSTGFNEASEAANIREKLILDKLRLHLPEEFNIGMAILSAVTKNV